ncbi:MAG: L,D-transpeptidase family protein [Rhizobiales bacterium]|nr:L,D-transpeptidase family protein [Hyphomicrobiales bacterium]
MSYILRCLAVIAATIVLAAFDSAQRPAEAQATVAFRGYPVGTVVIRTNQRRLFLIVGDGRAISYPVGVGRAGHQWSGTARINGKYVRPAWSPPADIKRANPKLPNVIEGGSPRNPMGVAALTLSGGEYAIHGTNQPGSIGRFVSHGCIRMHNRHVLDLYARVGVGTQVVVTR